MPQKPVLITVSGLSGSGKSTAAKALAGILPNTVHLDSDETRKEMFGVPATQKLPQEAYTIEATEKLIEETRRRITAHLKAGRNVVQSVMLVSDIARDRQEELAEDCSAEFQGIWLSTDAKTLFERVAARKNDASDASLPYVKEQQLWDIGTVEWPVIDASLPRETVLEEALKILKPLIEPAAGQKPQTPPQAKRA